MASPVTKQVSPRRRLFTKAVDIAIWVAVLGVLVLAVMPSKSGPNVGKPATTVQLQSVGSAESARLLPGELKRPLLIEAFASWCGACRRNAGVLDDLRAAQTDGRLDVVAVSVDDSPRKALAAKNDWPIRAEVLHDAQGDFAREYKVEVLPTYILVGTDGQVKRVTSGNPGASDIRAWLTESDN